MAFIQQALSASRQNPTILCNIGDSFPAPMSGSTMFPCLVEESPAQTSGSRFNSTLVMQFPVPIEEEECDRWSLLSLAHGSDDGGEEIALLERRELHDFSTSVASSPAPHQPMLGIRDHPTLVEESLVPHYIVVEESPAPMNGVEDHPCVKRKHPKGCLACLHACVLHRVLFWSLPRTLRGDEPGLQLRCH